MTSIIKDPSAWAITGLMLGSSILSGQTPPPAAAPRARTAVISSSMTGGSYIGVGLGEVDSERAKQLKLKEEYGVELTHVDEDSPASKAGLKSGDVVLEYNGQRVEGMEQFARFVRETPVGREVKVAVSRDGNRQMIIVKVGQRKSYSYGYGAGSGSGSGSGSGYGVWPTTPVAPMPPGEMPRPFMVWASPRLGIDGEAVDGQLGQFFGVKEGVLIRSVNKGSAAEKAGLKAGDVITKVDGNAVMTPADITRAMRSARSKKTFPLTVVREKRETTLNATIDEEDRSEQRQWYRLDHGGDGDFRFAPEEFEIHFDGPPFVFEFPPSGGGSRTIRTIRL